MKNEPKKQCIITYKDFVLEPTTFCKDKFDLYRRIKSEKTGKETKKLIGYGYSFEEAIRKLIGETLSNNSEIIDIKGYVSEYRKAVEEVKSILK